MIASYKVNSLDVFLKALKKENFKKTLTGKNSLILYL